MTKTKRELLDLFLIRQNKDNSRKCDFNGCLNTFKPLNGNHRYCSRKCERAAKKQVKKDRMYFSDYNSRAALVDRKERQQEKNRKRAIQASPDLDKMICVPVYDGCVKFTIYVKSKKDIQKAKETYLNRKINY